jgi:RNase H-like domain found in reverse transcriptase
MIQWSGRQTVWWRYRRPSRRWRRRHIWPTRYLEQSLAEHVGAALHQLVSPSDAWRPLGFFSKKLEPAQVRYSAFDREQWACYSGICHFRHMLEGRPFSIHMDHKPLTQALHRSSPQAPDTGAAPFIRPLDGQAVPPIGLHC